MSTGTEKTGPDRTSTGAGKDVVITIDAMGGDRDVSHVVRGMGKSLRKNPQIRYIVHGDADLLNSAIRANSPLSQRCEIRHADSVIAMDEKPSRALRAARGSSMWNALESVKNGESSAVISCGNTGALMAMSMLALRKAPGVNRPAIAILWPSTNPNGYNVVLDAGADIRADPDDLLTFALMGASYARNALGIERPRIGLLNVGTEEHKGRSELHAAAQLIEAAGPAGEFEYIGYVEGGDMPSDRVDVIVTDGFTGNVALKSAEGTAKLIGSLLREAFTHTILSRIGGMFAVTSLRRFQKRIDPRRVNGGVFLGLNGTVIKSHGSSDATGISAAIKLACTLSEIEFTRKLAARVACGGQSGTGRNAEVEGSGT
ncbi:phosphate acyltransferase PlsX [Amaricoccus tamworthensis]|uniref:phosphate acyltransferase PlsX n=1 Tax=Amaricoccus tamworthensis TaxID=57002 RepID=UPI003C7C3F3B